MSNYQTALITARAAIFTALPDAAKGAARDLFFSRTIEEFCDQRENLVELVIDELMESSLSPCPLCHIFNARGCGYSVRGLRRHLLGQATAKARSCLVMKVLEDEALERVEWRTRGNQ